ncbi:MAG: arylesterase [Catalinimonas sp.]
MNKEHPRPPQTILCFGDSLTAGFGVDASASYPSRIQKLIDAHGGGYRVVNAGRSGDTTVGGRQRLDHWLRDPVDVFVLELGVNDLFRGLPLSQTRANLQEMISKVKVRHHAARQVLVGMEVPLPVRPERIDDFHRMYRELAEDNGIPLVPFMLRGVAGYRHLNLFDGIHPNAAGYELVAENVWAVLRGVLGLSAWRM